MVSLTLSNVGIWNHGAVDVGNASLRRLNVSGGQGSLQLKLQHYGLGSPDIAPGEAPYGLGTIRL